MTDAFPVSFTTAQWIGVALGVGLLALFAVMAYRAWVARRITPEERERQRRSLLVSIGKMGDATIVEVREDFLIYEYSVRGVEYTASQDVAVLKDRVPEDLSQIKAVSVRYDPRNPANSIVVAEQWTGLHVWDAKRQNS
jgi:hypothetical protein